MILDMLLSLEGYDLVLVKDGREALEYLKDHTPDLAILDVSMPYLTGIEVCDRMRRIARLKDVPVILLTAHQDDNTMTMAKLVQVTEVVHKPLGGKDFRKIVRDLLEPVPADGGDAQT